VKPSDPANPAGHGIRRQPGGRFNTFNTPVRLLITFAYQIQGYQLVGGPDWLNNERFDIVAKMEGDPPAVIPGTGADHMMLATRTLLADRFKLKIHKETRELDIYALTMAKAGGRPGPKLVPAKGGCSPEELAARRGAPPPSKGGPPPVICGIQQGPGRIRFGNYPLELFARSISARVGRAVVDRTGLTGNWEFELEFQPEVPSGGQLPPGATPPPIDPDAPNFFTALQEQLGLKLDATKGPEEVWVIDSVEHPTPE
jgi:bla regulator protein blaR1